LRADLSAGPLTYGKLFEAMPFDNRLVRLNLTGRELKRVFTSHFSRGGSIVSVSGVQVRVLCESGALSVSLTRERGRSILDDDPLTVVTSDFLATGGDRLFEPVTPLRVVSSAEGDPVMRDAMAERLRARGGSLREGQLIDPRAPRLAYEGRRPIRCAPRAAESISPFPAPYAGPASAPAPGIFSSAAAPAPGPEGAPEPAPSWAIMQSDVLAG
jgi:hypothetical protein